MKKQLIFCLPILLAACAITPEQKAQLIQEQKRQAQNLQIYLATQCDLETAELMREQFEQKNHLSQEDRQNFRLRYIEKINDPLFQACYKMAGQNYMTQQRLYHLQNYYEHQYLRYTNPFYRPWFW